MSTTSNSSHYRTASLEQDEKTGSLEKNPSDHPPASMSEHDEKIGMSEHSPSHPSVEEPQHLPRLIRAQRDSNSRPSGRTIVVCLDGTGDMYDSDNSSIVHFVSCLKKSSPDQITYYQSGIGTYDGGGLSKGFRAASDMAIGTGLGVHIRDAYHFLMQNYVDNDRICLVGFSRGAYTARCLAGMIHKVGLLPAHNISQIQFAYNIYKDDSPNGWEMSKGFKRTFCQDVSVYFIGVFDSVASVGFIPRTLPLSSTPFNKSGFFRHAISLDERRAKFKPCRFERKDHITSQSWKTVAELQDQPNTQASPLSPNIGAERQTNGNALMKYAPDHRREAKDTDVLEVWFAGCHANVGGGAVSNEVRHKLSQVPLRWMIRQCFECDTGILFKAESLAVEGLDVHTLWPTYRRLNIPTTKPPQDMLDKYEKGAIPPITQRSTVLKPVNKDEPLGLQRLEIWKDDEKRTMVDEWVPEQYEDYFDAIASINDQLVEAKAWWILEVLPVQIRVLAKETNNWTGKTAMNMGRHRAVQERTPNLHWTVEQRIESLGYKIRTRGLSDATWNIVV